MYLWIRVFGAALFGAFALALSLFILFAMTLLFHNNSTYGPDIVFELACDNDQSMMYEQSFFEFSRSNDMNTTNISQTLHHHGIATPFATQVLGIDARNNFLEFSRLGYAGRKYSLAYGSRPPTAVRDDIA